MSLEKDTNRKTFVSIKNGSLCVKTDETNPEARAREYTNPQTGEKGVAYELVYDNLRGNINSIEVKDGKFGKQLIIGIDDTALALGIEGRYAIDIMKKLPNVNLEEEINIVPYSFTGDNGKKQQGVTIYQDEKKIPDFFSSKDKNGKVKLLNGMPEPEKEYKDMSKDDWKIYFINVRKFLEDYLVENIIPQVASEDDESTIDEAIDSM